MDGLDCLAELLVIFMSFGARRRRHLAQIQDLRDYVHKPDGAKAFLLAVVSIVLLVVGLNLSGCFKEL